MELNEVRICQNSASNLMFYNCVGKKGRPDEYEIEHQPDLIKHRFAS